MDTLYFSGVGESIYDQIICTQHVRPFVHNTSDHLYTTRQIICTQHVRPFVHNTSDHLYTIHQIICTQHIRSSVHNTSDHLYTTHQEYLLGPCTIHNRCSKLCHRNISRSVRIERCPLMEENVYMRKFMYTHVDVHMWKHTNVCRIRHSLKQ